jgi:hypothetical protein
MGLRPSWHLVISLTSLITYITVTKTPPSLLWIFVGVIFGVFIDVDHVLHALVFQRELTLHYFKHLAFAGFYKEFRDEGVFDNLWFHKILWKNIFYYTFSHGIFILFVFWFSPSIFGSLDIPIRIAIVIHYLSDIIFHTYSHVAS